MKIKFLFLIIFLSALQIHCRNTISKMTDVKYSSELLPNIEIDSLRINNLNSFLRKPIDIDSFMILKNYNFNSGGLKPDTIYYRPDTIGFYYRYFLFPKPESYNSDYWMEMFHEDGIRLITYIFGSKIERSAENELIEIKSRVNDSALMRCNFVDKSIDDIISEFGNNFIKVGSSINYYNENKLLILWIENNKVKEFKYIKANRKIDTLIINRKVLEYKWNE